MLKFKKLQGISLAALLLALVLGVQLASAPPAYCNTYPLVSPYAELAAAWSQWVVIEPPATNPSSDTTGQYAGKNQFGSTWFLSGIFAATPVERTVSIPAGKSLFFPIVNAVYWDGPGSIDDPQPIAPEGEKRQALYDLINYFDPNNPGELKLPGTITCTLDGADVPVVRSQSPAFILAFVYDDNILGAPAGYYFPTVADGLWSLLDPLPVGSYELKFTAFPGDLEELSFFQDVTYHITVVPLPPSLLLAAPGLLGLLAWRRRI